MKENILYDSLSYGCHKLCDVYKITIHLWWLLHNVMLSPTNHYEPSSSYVQVSCSTKLSPVPHCKYCWKLQPKYSHSKPWYYICQDVIWCDTVHKTNHYMVPVTLNTPLLFRWNGMQLFKMRVGIHFIFTSLSFKGYVWTS